MIVYSAPSFAAMRCPITGVDMTKAIYISAKGRAALNLKLDAGVPVFGTVYTAPMDEDYERLDAMPHGTVVRMRKSRVHATHATGIWDAIDRQVLTELEFKRAQRARERSMKGKA
jgi:hypothetical protein